MSTQMPSIKARGSPSTDVDLRIRRPPAPDAAGLYWLPASGPGGHDDTVLAKQVPDAELLNSAHTASRL